MSVACSMMCVQGRWKRSGQSGFSRTTFSLKQKKQQKVSCRLRSVQLYGMGEKSLKYSNNAATVTPVLLQRASNNRLSVVSSTGLGVLHCGAGMRLRLGRGSVRMHNTCSVTTRTPKSTRYTKYSPPILLYYSIL